MLGPTACPNLAASRTTAAGIKYAELLFAPPIRLSSPWEIAVDRGSQPDGERGMQAWKFAAGGLALSLIACPLAANADTKIVALGASNTAGFGASFGQSYPAQLEAMLKANGYKVQVVNAGIPGDTTRGMLARLDASVPADARIVILQPGGNDLRFGYPK